MIVIQLISFIRSQFSWLPFVQLLNARAGLNKYTSTFSNQITMAMIFFGRNWKQRFKSEQSAEECAARPLLHFQFLDDKPIRFLSTFWELKKLDLLSWALFQLMFSFLSPFLRLLIQHNIPPMPSSGGWFVLSLSRGNSRRTSAVFFTNQVMCCTKQCFQQRAVFYTNKKYFPAKSSISHYQVVFCSKEMGCRLASSGEKKLNWEKRDFQLQLWGKQVELDKKCASLKMWEVGT